MNGNNSWARIVEYALFGGSPRSHSTDGTFQHTCVTITPCPSPKMSPPGTTDWVTVTGVERSHRGWGYVWAPTSFGKSRQRWQRNERRPEDRKRRFRAHPTYIRQLQPDPLVEVYLTRRIRMTKRSYRQQWKTAHATYGGEIRRGDVKSSMKI